MLVNAFHAPGPALWQGIMLCALPIAVVGMYLRDGRFFWWSVGCYLAFGAGVMIAIVRH